VSAARRWPRFAGLGLLLAGAAVMDTVRLSQNGYANIFYSAGVRSMVDSWQNFWSVSFDPGGLVTIDKPPLALWAQALSARIFGFSPLSILLPEALMGIATVAVLYLILVRRFGLLAAFTGGLALVVFPSFVAVSRANGVDPLLILLMLAACAAAIRACESGRLRELLLSGVLVGLAFNTKTLAAYLVVPAIAGGYVICGPGSLVRRILQLLAAGLAMFVVSFAWIAVVEATPSSKRPFVGGSTNNTELGLTFEYNGFGRVGGQTGGPGQVIGRHGAAVPIERQRAVERASRLAHPHLVEPAPPKFPPSPYKDRSRYPVPFGAAPGPLRLFGKGLGDQGGWYLPFAVVGLLALLLLLRLESRWDPDPGEAPPAGPATPESASAEPAAPAEDPSAPATTHTGTALMAPSEPATATEAPARRLRPRVGPPETLRGRRDPRLACALVLGGWMATEAVILSASKGIVHPYYMSALAPGAAAMAGVGVPALARLCCERTALLGFLLAALAVLGTVAVEIIQMHREHYMVSFEPVLLAGTAILLSVLGLTALLRRARLAPGATIALVGLLVLALIVPARYASSTWLAPVQSTFPAAGPTQAVGHGGIGLNIEDETVSKAILRYVRAHGVTPRFELLTVASDTAAPFILLGMKAAAAGGYSGIDPVLDGPGLARLVARHEARWVLLGGEYASRGGNAATHAVLTSCRELAPAEWSSPVHYPYGLVLFDCAGHVRKLAAA